MPIKKTRLEGSHFVLIHHSCGPPVRRRLLLMPELGAINQNCAEKHVICWLHGSSVFQRLSYCLSTSGPALAAKLKDTCLCLLSWLWHCGLEMLEESCLARMFSVSLWRATSSWAFQFSPHTCFDFRPVWQQQDYSAWILIAKTFWLLLCSECEDILGALTFAGCQRVSLASCVRHWPLAADVAKPICDINLCFCSNQSVKVSERPVWSAAACPAAGGSPTELGACAVGSPQPAIYSGTEPMYKLGIFEFFNI